MRYIIALITLTQKLKNIKWIAIAGNQSRECSQRPQKNMILI